MNSPIKRTSPSVLVAAISVTAALSIVTFVALNSISGQNSNPSISGQNSNPNSAINSKSSSNQEETISAVPEANPGLVMLPFIGAVLLFSSARFCGAKRNEV
jgi:hypothetical protein